MFEVGYAAEHAYKEKNVAKFTKPKEAKRLRKPKIPKEMK
jgi:hypothetical protein